MADKYVSISPKARRLIIRLIATADAYAFLGSSHPDDWAAIEDEHMEAQNKLCAYISKLEEQAAHDPR